MKWANLHFNKVTLGHRLEKSVGHRLEKKYQFIGCFSNLSLKIILVCMIVVVIVAV